MKREKQKYKEGDILPLKFSGRNYGFGKNYYNVTKEEKSEEFHKKIKNYGLAHLMGPALIVKVYHKLSDPKDIDRN